MKKKISAAAIASVFAYIPVLAHAQSDSAADSEAAAAAAGPVATVEIATHKTRSAVAMTKSVTSVRPIH